MTRQQNAIDLYQNFGTPGFGVSPRSTITISRYTSTFDHPSREMLRDDLEALLPETFNFNVGAQRYALWGAAMDAAMAKVEAVTKINFNVHAENSPADITWGSITNQFSSGGGPIPNQLYAFAINNFSLEAEHQIAGGFTQIAFLGAEGRANAANWVALHELMHALGAPDIIQDGQLEQNDTVLVYAPLYGDWLSSA